MGRRHIILVQAGRLCSACLPAMCHIQQSTYHTHYLFVAQTQTCPWVGIGCYFFTFFFLKFSFFVAFLEKLNFIDPFSFSFLLSMYPHFTPVIIFATKGRIVWKVWGMVLKVINFQKQIILFSILPKMNEKLLCILGF